MQLQPSHDKARAPAYLWARFPSGSDRCLHERFRADHMANHRHPHRGYDDDGKILQVLSGKVSRTATPLRLYGAEKENPPTQRGIFFMVYREEGSKLLIKESTSG